MIAADDLGLAVLALASSKENGGARFLPAREQGTCATSSARFQFFPGEDGDRQASRTSPGGLEGRKSGGARARGSSFYGQSGPETCAC